MIDLESPWLQHPRIWWTVAVVGAVLSVGMWLWGRDVPTRIGVQYNIPTVTAGKSVHIVVPALRNLNRKCSVDISRTFVSSEHSRTLLTPKPQHVSSSGLEDREEDTPGQLVIDVPIPEDAPAGPSEIETENQYWCPFNPSTWFKKIEDRWTFRFIVVRPVTP